MSQINENDLDLPLDKGIRRYVLILREAGIETFESCQGGEGHACPEPMIRFLGGGSEGFKAFAVAKDNHLPVMELNLSYDVTDDRMLQGPYWKMIFKRADL